MQRRFLRLAAAIAAAAAILPLPIARGADGFRVTGPIQHENLAIYFVRGRSAAGAIPLTLAEALERDAVRVIETGNVSRLEIENLGDVPVFVQAGDIVKGGKQDRVLTVSLLLAPRSGRIGIAAFCVEQGRWSARAGESAARFESANASVPSREAKLALRRLGAAIAQPASGARSEPHGRGPLPSADPQGEVWRSVSNLQARLAGSLGSSVASPQSRTSLPLSLENERLKAAQDEYVRALKQAGEADEDIVGYVFAVNGRLNSAEVYPSNGLFRKMWSKLLVASVTEAIGERSRDAPPPPTAEAAAAFLAAAEAGTRQERAIVAGLSEETRESDAGYFLETRKREGAWLHRSYVAK